MKVLELRGIESLRALNAFSVLMLGLKMIPEYHNVSYEDFLASIQAMPDDDQLKVIRKAVQFVRLEREEIEALVGFCEDANGVPYSSVNIKNLTADQFVDCIVAVCGQIAKIKVDLVSPAEKKN